MFQPTSLIPKASLNTVWHLLKNQWRGSRGYPHALLLIALLVSGPGCSSVQRRLPDTPYERLDQSLTRCRVAWEHLKAGTADAEGDYRRQLAAVLRELNAYSEVRTWNRTQPMGGWRVTFAGDPQGRDSVPPCWCERIEPAPSNRKTEGVTRYIYHDGTGLPVVMKQKPDGPGLEPFMPRNGRCLPATLTAEFTGRRKVTLTFHHTRNVQSAKIQGAVRPLAVDLTAVVIQGMDRKFLQHYAFRGLVRPDDHVREAGIYTPEIYDPEKIPLVLTHGIESAPHIWRNVMNEIAADPELRRKYQVWYFLYPTGLPIHLASARLRMALTRARDFYDPQHKSKAMDQMVLCGHSMGGVLTRMVVVDSGEDIYRAFFKVPPEQLRLSPANLQLVRQTLYFEHLPFVKRAIFITTPHRGSHIPDFPVVKLATFLMKPTSLVGRLFKELSDAANEAVNPAMFHFIDMGGRSTASLSPKHPLLPAINARPIRVPFHNIIAVWPPMNINKPLEQSTDGAVDYDSSFLPGAESTEIIRAWHSCIHTPALAEKLLPLLKRHAGIRGAHQSPPPD